jgi:sugar lactone lactonase YvrE
MNLDQLQALGHNLCRAECILTHKSGLIFGADWTETGGISVIKPSGDCAKLLTNTPSLHLRPNGIALESGGTFLLTHLGDTDGGVFRLHADGHAEAVVTHADGAPLPPTNFVTFDPAGRLWITVSTRVTPRANDYRASANTGFIAIAEPGQTNARIVADGLGYTNECVIHPETNKVYINETFGRRISAFTLKEDGSLCEQRVLTQFGAGTYPDGLALDTSGNLWVTSIVSNRIIKVSPDGHQQLMLEDSDSQHLKKTEQAYQNNSLGREHLDNAHSRILKNCSCLAFGGNDLTTAYIGNLLDDCIHLIPTNTTGVAMPHWDCTLGPLEHYLD